jgi:hypothetical protein
MDEIFLELRPSFKTCVDGRGPSQIECTRLQHPLFAILHQPLAVMTVYCRHRSSAATSGTLTERTNFDTWGFN